MENQKSLIKVVQLPVIEEHLKQLKERWEKYASDAESMVCTEETIHSVKSFRADMRKEYEELENLRKQVKKSVMEPYNQFETVYKECVTMAFKQADGVCSGKVSEIEIEQKRKCEERLRDYFKELCIVNHVEWLEFDRVRIKIDMASTKQKTPKRLMKELAEFVEDVANNVQILSGGDYATEMLAEYKETLDFTGTVMTVRDRHRRMEEERIAQEARNAAMEQETEHVQQVEALTAPKTVEVAEEEPVWQCVFTVHATKTKLKKLKKFMESEGIKYE